VVVVVVVMDGWVANRWIHRKHDLNRGRSKGKWRFGREQ